MEDVYKTDLMKQFYKGVTRKISSRTQKNGREHYCYYGF